MARKDSPTILQEELYLPPDQPSREEFDDPRVLDLDVEEESPFLRAQKRVPARRGSLPRKTATRLLWGALALTVAVLCAASVAALYHYGEHSWRFRIESSDDIEITGLQNVTRAQVMDVLGGDIGRNIFFVPLAQRKAQLEQIPWVASASVMRFVPNRLRVEIHERIPVAFARVGPRILLVDSSGTLMELPPQRKYSFPVIVGMNSGEPHSTREARMKIYTDFIRQLDSSGAHYSQDLSEVDLSDPDDVKVTVSSSDGEVLVHLGSGNYLARYQIYVSHVQEWRQQFNRLDSVDLRYDNQIVVNPDLGAAPKQPPISASAARAALAAGVKSAALVSHQFIAPRPLAVVPPVARKEPPKPAHLESSRGTARKTALKRPASNKALHRRAVRNTGFHHAAIHRPVRHPAAGSKGVVKASSTTNVVAGRGSKKPSPVILKGQERQ
jgi:cell division protein FtsQ